MVIDSNGVSNSAKLSEIIQVKDGYNVAFVYNSSSTDSDTSLCQVNFFLAKKSLIIIYDYIFEDVLF